MSWVRELKQQTEIEKEGQESKILRTLQQPCTSCLSFSNWSFALNRRRGDAHKPERKTERLVNTNLQWREILLSCSSFSNPVGNSRKLRKSFKGDRRGHSHFMAVFFTFNHLRRPMHWAYYIPYQMDICDFFKYFLVCNMCWLPTLSQSGSL